MKKLTLAIALALVPTAVSAKPFYKDWKWWVGYGAIIGANALDLASTARVAYVCAGCQETNIFSQGKPRYGRMLAINLVGEGAVHYGLSHFARKNIGSSRWVTASDFMWPAASWAQHLPAAIGNYRIANQVYANHVALDIPLPGGQTPWRHYAR